MSMVRVKSYKVGDMIPVESVSGGYPLPEGLPEGAVVRVVQFVHAYRLVEWQGKQFKVYMANLQPGLEEYRLRRKRG
jgi:hypothetical protein